MLQESQIQPMALAVELKRIFVEPLLCPKYILGVKATIINQNTRACDAHGIYSLVWESGIKLLISNYMTIVSTMKEETERSESLCQRTLT